MNSELDSEVSSQDSGGGSHFAQFGFEILANLLSPSECESLAKKLSMLYDEDQKRTPNKIGGIRNLLQRSPDVLKLALSDQLTNILRSRQVPAAFPVRALFFDKTPGTNWRVPWHQDLTIAVSTKIELPGFVGWSKKEGILHVQPPQYILESMATVRIHLDDCDLNNGALKIVPCSHSCGKLDSAAISESAGKKQVTCEMKRGSALLMRPLLLHSSSPAKNPSHRRIVHIEYATQNLPDGLEWFNA